MPATLQPRVSHPGRQIRLRAHDHHIGHMDRRLALYDSALRITGSRPRVMLAKIDPFHDHPLLVANNAEHGPPLPFVIAADNLYRIAFSDTYYAT